MNDTLVKLIGSSSSFVKEKLKDEVTNNISRIGAEHFWNQGYTGKGVVVAIIDTGCNYHHLDLKDRIIGGYNFTKESNGEVTNFEDLNGHGTHVAGTIAASVNDVGIVGVAPDVSLLILKVLDYRGSGTVDSLVKAIEYAMNWTGPNNERVNVLSLSLGISSSNEILHNTIKQTVSKNIAVVVASGNEGDGDLSTDEYSYPAGYEEVIAVGAMDNNNEVANFTNTNKEVDIYAPGVDIKSTYINKDYANLSGTSMAAPHVTGALALLINKYEDLKNSKPNESELFEYLMQHTTKIQIGDYREMISILNLSLDVSIEDDSNEQFETKLDKSLLLKCFCEARKTQAFFTQCLNEDSTEYERKFLISLIQESASTAMHIKNLCKTI
ncbi:S8 family peptidase [Lysinibacillus sp. NPDC097214]|uniref:S8 family peptidase n=1 Tax=Lysinibacillus sp. NPDC097214 TaxID=3390584 RepID=UPI003CFF540F